MNLHITWVVVICCSAALLGCPAGKNKNASAMPCPDGLPGEWVQRGEMDWACYQPLDNSSLGNDDCPATFEQAKAEFIGADEPRTVVFNCADGGSAISRTRDMSLVTECHYDGTGKLMGAEIVSDAHPTIVVGTLNSDCMHENVGCAETDWTAYAAGTSVCETTLDLFQAEQLNCASDYAAAQIDYAHQQGDACTTAFFDCSPYKAAAYQYGFTGDNVQCYYDSSTGTLSGGIRTSDHGPSTVFGLFTLPSCYTGPSCN